MRTITAIAAVFLGACGGKKMTATESCEAFDLAACADDPDEHASTWAPLGACAEERTCDQFRACFERAR